MARREEQEHIIHKPLKSLPNVRATNPELTHTESLQFIEALRTTNPRLYDAIHEQAETVTEELKAHFNHIPESNRYVLTEAELQALVYHVAQSSSATVLSMTGSALAERHQSIRAVEKWFYINKPGTETEPGTA